MRHNVRTPPLAIALTIFSCLALPAARAGAAEVQIREFSIEVEGKAAGTYIMTITKQDDGAVSVHSLASLTFKHFWGTYKYSFQGIEHWRDGRIAQISSKCDDDGKKTEVTGTADQEWLHLKINGKDHKYRPDVWTTTYWMLPPAKYHNNKVPLLDADTGKEYIGNLAYKGVEQVLVGGRAQNCYHFHVTGGPTSPTDLWFDGEHRLVRQEFTDQGRRVIFILTAVQRQN